MDQQQGNIRNLNGQETYHRYISYSSRSNPRLPKLTETLKKSSITAQTRDSPLFGSLIVKDRVSDQLVLANRCNGLDARHISEEGISSARIESNDRWIIIAEDVQPEGMLYLGQSFETEPIAFEQYLNRGVTFQSQSSQFIVFDYPETYQSNGTSFRDCTKEPVYSTQHSESSPVRLWMDTYAFFQRIVWIIGPSDSHILLMDTLPMVRCPATYHLSRKSATFKDFIQSGETSSLSGSSNNSCHHVILCSLLDKSSAPNLRTQVAETIVHFLCLEWEVMLQRVQENISEATAPLTGDLKLIEEVLQRKHVFEKLQRTISVVISSVTSIPLDVNEVPPKLHQLRQFENFVEGWAGQLGKVSESMLGMLMITESRRAAGQAIQSRNIQLLAFLFISISTVASIFGMNTLEVNGSNPRMWQFAVAATGSTILAALIAWLHRYHDSIAVIGFLNSASQYLESIKRLFSPRSGPATSVPLRITNNADENLRHNPRQFASRPRLSQRHIRDLSLEPGPENTLDYSNGESLLSDEFLVNHSKRHRSCVVM